MDVEIITGNTVKDLPKTRPWVRFWARQFDYVLCIYLFLPLSFIESPVLDEIPEFTYTIIAGAVCCILEMFLLSGWGYTPGKWLLKIAVRNADNSKLTLSQAALRSFNVWTLGNGLNLKDLGLVFSLMAYYRLRNSGRTFWDSLGNFKVSHEDIGGTRISILILTLLINLALVVWLFYLESLQV